MLRSLKNKVVMASRRRKLEHFYALCPGGKILDVGVSSEARVPGENVFLETYRFADDTYVGLGVEDLSAVADAYPGKRFVRYEGVDFPFEDDEFDWIFSNAVIEHVGDHDRQVHFLNEMVRVSKNVFFTTPNRYFPVESHTNAVFLHWLPGDTFFQWCAKHRPHWSRTNLQLLSKADLKSVVRSSNALSYEIFSNRLLGWPITYTVVCNG